MSDEKIPNYSLLIKRQQRQIQLQELLLEHHVKIEAKMEIILKTDLNKFSTVQLYNFLWGMSDLVISAKNLNEQLLNILLQAV